MVGWYHQFNGHEFGPTLGHGEGQGSLVCYSPWGHDLVTEQQESYINKLYIGCDLLFLASFIDVNVLRSTHAVACYQ